MRIGAHVSTAGGLVAAHDRAVERGCESMQVFNQSPRAWRPTAYTSEDLDAFRRAREDGPIEGAVIHAVYLINCAAPEPEVRRKSLASLVHALHIGDGMGADGVVLHPGSAKKDPIPEAMGRIAEAIGHGLAESESCSVLLEDTAGAGATIGRSLPELAELIDRAGADERIGVCLDCCHLLASGYEVRTAESLATVVDEFDRLIGLERLRCLHVNDSQASLGSNRDRHANLGKGELGDEGIATFLSEPRFEGLPAILEIPGPARKGPEAADVAGARQLRERGIAARRRAGRR